MAGTPLTVSVVLFDLGGVLVELQGPSALMRLSGHTRTREEVRASWQRCSAVKAFETGRISVEAFAERVVHDLGLPITVETFLQDYPTWMSRLHTNSIDVLRLASRHCRIAALSNISAVHWGELEAGLAQAPAFDQKVLSFETGWMKPEPEAYQVAIDRLGELPERVLFLDDSEANVVQARRMGMQAELTHNAHEARVILEHRLLNKESRTDGEKC